MEFSTSGVPVTHAGAKVVLAGSLALLAAVGAVWFTGDPGPSSNLAGEAVRLRAPVATAANSQARRERRTGFFPERPGFATKMRPASQMPVTDVDPPVVDASPSPRPTFPKRIAIPSLGVDASVVSVGLETDGSMEIPGATEAGWYHYGPRPGDATGSAVLAGHVDHQKQPGVFIELRRIELGSDIEVIDDDGSSHRFRVTERFQIDKDELPAEELFRKDGDPVLTLITCGGKFSSRSRHYADNIVIRATPVPGDVS